MKSVKSLVAGVALSALASSSWAASHSALLQPAVDAFTKDLGAALSYKAVTPAEPLGLIGFDIGLETSFTKVASMDQWASAVGGTDVAYLPFPKIHIHKGLPLGIDLGAVYSKVPSTDISYAGGEIRYSFVSGNLAIPAVAVRGTYTTLMGVEDASLTTKGVELTVSKGFLMFTPYAGIGQIWADSNIGASLTDPLLGDLEGSVSMSKWFVGLNLNLGLMNIVYETDKTGDAQTHTIKLGFRF